MDRATGVAVGPRMGRPSEVMVSRRPGRSSSTAAAAALSSSGVAASTAGRVPKARASNSVSQSSLESSGGPSWPRATLWVPVRFLEKAQLLEHPGAQHPGPVRGPEHGGVEGRDDVPAGVAPGDLLHAQAGDLLGGDELHLPQGGDRLELALGEHAVLAGVHHRQAQLGLAVELGRVDAEVQALPERLRPGRRRATPAGPSRGWRDGRRRSSR